MFVYTQSLGKNEILKVIFILSNYNDILKKLLKDEK